MPLGRAFGISIRVHLLFPLVAAGLILRAAYKPPTGVAGQWADVAMLMGLLFLSVLLHEFGHCFGARLVDGDAQEVLLWPLGGLASVEVPHTARAHFVTALAGPLVNLLACLGCAALLSLVHERGVRPPWNPFVVPFREDAGGHIALWAWDGTPLPAANGLAVVLLVRLFFVNWVLFLLNVVLVGFPMDGGRMLQCALWPRLGFHQATVVAVYVGFLVALLVSVFSIVVNELLPFALAGFIGLTCWRQWVVLVTGGEESLMGYDFSQGYTSLERDAPRRPRRRRPNFYQRWKQTRLARRLAREQETREAEERRVDELLEKWNRDGKDSLTAEEHRFLKRVSEKYKNNRQ